jgi:hypothetical protein
MILSASGSRPFAINQRGDSGRRSTITVMNSPGMPPIRNMICQPNVGTSRAPIWPVTISPTGKIIS